MPNELENKKNELFRLLYNNDEEIIEVDKNSVQKTMFELIRECIKEKEFDVEIGNYILNVSLDNLSVIYETEDNIIEISNKDVYYETTRETESRMFLLTTELKDEYPPTIPAIEVTGVVTNIDGDCEELYQFGLFTNTPDNVKKYITLTPNDQNPNPVTYSGMEIETPYAVVIKRKINPNYNLTDVKNFINNNNIVEVLYDYTNQKYVRVKDNTRVINSYRELLPSLDDKKNLISFLYNTIVSFYREYMNNNL